MPSWSMPAHGNLFAELPSAPLPDELISAVWTAPDLRIERIVSTGQASPPGEWYDQERHEWVVLLRGAARLLFEDEGQPRSLAPGDYLHIAARRRHRVLWTDPEQVTIWLAIHYGAA